MDLRNTLTDKIFTGHTQPIPVSGPIAAGQFIDAVALDVRFADLGGLPPDQPGQERLPIVGVVNGRSRKTTQRRLVAFAAGVDPNFVPAGLGIYQSDPVGQSVQTSHFLRGAPLLAGKLAVQFVNAVEQPPEEDGEIGCFVLLVVFFQPGGGEETDGELAAGQVLPVELADAVNGRPIHKQIGHSDEGLAGNQAGLEFTAQGVNGRDRLQRKSAQSFTPAGANTFALAGFIDGEDDVGQVLEPFTKKGEGEAKTVARFQAGARWDRRDDGVGAGDRAGVEVGREQPAGRTSGCVFRRGVAAPAGLRASGPAHGISQGVTQAVAGLVAAQFDGRGGNAVEAEMGEL